MQLMPKYSIENFPHTGTDNDIRKPISRSHTRRAFL